MIHDIQNINYIKGALLIVAGLFSLSYFGNINIYNETIWIIIGCILILKGIGFFKY